MKAAHFKTTPGETKTEEILIRKEYKVNYLSDIYDIIIEKTNYNIIIRNNYYELKLNPENLSLLTNTIFNSIDDAFEFMINIFNNNQYFIKGIFSNKILLGIQIYDIMGNKKEIELELKENFEDKNYLIKELFNKYIKIEKDLNEVKKDNNILKVENNKLNKDNMNLKMELESIKKNNINGLQIQINNINNMINQIQQRLKELDNVIQQINKIQNQINSISMNMDTNYLNLNNQFISNNINKNNIQLNNINSNKDGKLNTYTSILINDNTYNNYNIELKKLRFKLKYHTKRINCSTVLTDGRFVTGSDDHSIIIYNNKTFKPDLTIKEHSSDVYCLTQLCSRVLASGSYDKTIKLININGNGYNVIQTLTYHTNPVTKIIELKNKTLVSCSGDNNIIFYFKNNNEYTKDYTIKTNGANGPIIQTKDNEICYYESTNSALCFFDLEERKNITKLNNISTSNHRFDSLVMINKDLLIATGINKMTIININSHSIVRSIDVNGSSWIRAVCLLTDDTLLTCDDNRRIIQWKIEGDNLILISKKENAHEAWINTIKKIGNGLIMSGDANGEVKIW